MHNEVVTILTNSAASRASAAVRGSHSSTEASMAMRGCLAGNPYSSRANHTGLLPPRTSLHSRTTSAVASRVSCTAVQWYQVLLATNRLLPHVSLDRGVRWCLRSCEPASSQATSTDVDRAARTVSMIILLWSLQRVMWVAHGQVKTTVLYGKANFRKHTHATRTHAHAHTHKHTRARTAHHA